MAVIKDTPEPLLLAEISLELHRVTYRSLASVVIGVLPREGLRQPSHVGFQVPGRNSGAHPRRAARKLGR
jgi:hypothetical protein